MNSEALNALKRVKILFGNSPYNKELEIIEDNLKRLEIFDYIVEKNVKLREENALVNKYNECEKLKKVIALLINKLDIEMYTIHENGVTKHYLFCSDGGVIVNQEEYNLLKELLNGK